MKIKELKKEYLKLSLKFKHIECKYKKNNECCFYEGAGLSWYLPQRCTIPNCPIIK